MDEYVDVGDDDLRPPDKEMKNGLYKSFHPNGMLKRMFHYCDDKLAGPLTILYDNGIMDLKAKVGVEKKVIGLHLKRHPDDFLYAHRFFDTSGRLHGICKIREKTSWWVHGAPKTYIIESDEYVHRIWIRAGVHHIIIRIVRYRNVSFFDITLYAPSSTEEPPYLVYKRKMPFRKFSIIENDRDDRRYAIYDSWKPDFPKIYIRELMGWYSIYMPYGRYVYDSMAEDILDGIENPYSATSIASGILRFLSNYGVYFPYNVNSFNKFIAIMKRLDSSEKIDDGAADT